MHAWSKTQTYENNLLDDKSLVYRHRCNGCLIVDNNHGNHRLYPWFSFQLHDGGSGHRLIDSSGLSVGRFLFFIIVRQFD